MAFKNWIAFVLLGLIWGSNFLLIKIAIRELPPINSAAYRVLFGLIGSILIVAIKKPGVPIRTRWKTFLMISLFNQVIPFTLIAWSQKYISTGMAAILNGTVPLFTTLFAYWFIKDVKLTPLKIVGLFISFLGVIILMSDQVHEGFGFSQVGQIIMLLACISFAIGNVVSKKITQGMVAETQTFGQLVMSIIIILPITLFSDGAIIIPETLPTWLAVICVGVFNTAVGTFLYFTLINSVGATRTSLVTYTFPLVAVILGVIFLNEYPGWQLLIGGAFVISGVVIVNSNVTFKRLFKSHATS